MNIGQILQKVKDMIAAAKAGNYLLAVKLAFEIMSAITDAMPPQAFNAPPKLQATGIDLTTADEDTILAEIEKCCQPAMNATPGDPAQGPVIDVLKPLIWAAIKKWLGI